MLKELRRRVLEENKGQFVRLIFANGFQMRGTLLDFDDNDMLIETTLYQSGPVVVPHSILSTFVPAIKE